MSEHQEIWCQPGDVPKRQFIVFFDDPTQDIATFSDEDEARTYWERARIDWNCYLLGTLPRQRTPNASTGSAPSSRNALDKENTR